VRPAHTRRRSTASSGTDQFNGVLPPLPHVIGLLTVDGMAPRSPAKHPCREALRLLRTSKRMACLLGAGREVRSLYRPLFKAAIAASIGIPGRLGVRCCGAVLHQPARRSVAYTDLQKGGLLAGCGGEIRSLYGPHLKRTSLKLWLLMHSEDQHPTWERVRLGEVAHQLLGVQFSPQHALRHNH